MRRWISLCLGLLACQAPAEFGPCEGGTWRAGTLEIHHLAVGQADATLLVGPTGRSLLIDAGESRWDGDEGARVIGPYLRRVLGCDRIDQALITHFHVDHAGSPGRGGLWHLVEAQGFTVGRLFHRDATAFRGDAGATLERWLAYLEGAGRRLRPTVAREGAGEVTLGPGVELRVVAADGHGVLRPGDFGDRPQPPNENDYSLALLLRFGRFDYFTGGDLSGQLSRSPFGYAYHDVETAVARGLPDVDVYRANHHGSDHSSNATLLAQLDPEVSIVSAGEGNPHGHPRRATLDRLRATSVVYLTERGAAGTDLAGVQVLGHVVVRSDGRKFAIGADVFPATDPVRVDGDGDGYYREADPDDASPAAWPAPRGGCDPAYQPCSAF